MDISKKILCDENIQSRSDFRKWAKVNHPDKNNNSSPSQRKFKLVSEFVNELLPTNESNINCPDIHTYEDNDDEINVEVDKSKINLKKADCIRMTENWGKINRQHRFDKSTFDKKVFLNDMKTMSPKLTEMINTIRKLDEEDLKNEKKVFKHFIFSDVKKGGYGAKIISSALVANGFDHCFTTSLKVKTPKQNNRKETFGIISSTAIYDKTFSQKHVKEVLKMYNNRPSNIHGDVMRFIVLDSGFKEGIDLFDVKYVHIFENQRNSADLIQAVGRATRSCGQLGLDFKPNVGWKLHIYQYNLTYEDSTPVFNDYLLYAGVNLNNIIFGENLEKMAILSAVDYELNYNINKYESTVESDILEIAYNSAVSGGTGYKGCSSKDKCGKRATKTVPFSIKLLSAAYKKRLPRGFNKLLSKDKRLFFCNLLRSDENYCKKVNEMYISGYKPRKYIRKNNKQIVLYNKQSQDKNHLQLALRTKSDNKTKNNLQLALPSTQSYFMDMLDDFEDMESLSFESFMKRVNRIFKEYKYQPIKIENNCVKKNNNQDDHIVTMTESQNFVTNYFVPNLFTKGLLVWHSVGTGKTCTAVSVKSFLFERLDYTVIWVTRTTLKEDIWKNMYDKICDHVIREKYEQGHRDNLRKFLSKRFIPPMSYKQFSNLLEGKNALYDKLVELNGKEDILNKTLIIVDEAHKLYSKDLIAAEKPNMQVIEKLINKSNTCKVLLMTGTPIADDPMEFLKLINLISKKYKFPTDINTFRREFMKNNQFTAKGKTFFQSKVKGLISYLNRRFDPRQFTQPVFHEVPVELSMYDRKFEEDCTKKVGLDFMDCVSNLPSPVYNIQMINDLTAKIESNKENIVEWKDRLKNDKLNVNIKQKIVELNLELKKNKETLKQVKASYKKETKLYDTKMKNCETVSNKALKNCNKEALLEKEKYQNTLLEKC